MFPWMYRIKVAVSAAKTLPPAKTRHFARLAKTQDLLLCVRVNLASTLRSQRYILMFNLGFVNTHLMPPIDFINPLRNPLSISNRKVHPDLHMWLRCFIYIVILYNQ